MYRIIGITEEGQMYVIKETFLKDEGTNTFSWNSISGTSGCLGDACEWSKADLYKRLNGEASNGNPIFVNSSEYGYMTKNSDWYTLIADHNWMYGDTNIATSSIKYNGNEMYDIETGNTSTTRYWPDEEQGQTYCSAGSLCKSYPCTWSDDKIIPAKIGLMYLHDVDYAYTKGNPGSGTNVKNSWIHFQKDGYNTSIDREWLITRFGVLSRIGVSVTAWILCNDGSADDSTLTYEYGVRPVFYLESNAKIASGSGTKSDPFILKI